MNSENGIPVSPAFANPLTRESCALLEAAEGLLKVQQLLDATAAGKLNHRQRGMLREWGSAAAQLADALVHFARATQPEGGRCQ